MSLFEALVAVLAVSAVRTAPYSRSVTADELRRGAGSRFLFHYTDAAKADAIITDRLFVAGPRVAHGFGVYATDIAPWTARRSRR